MSQAKSAPFVVGLMFGVIVALLAVIALRDGSAPAMAQSAASGPATAGNMTMVTGMSQQSLTDLVFVLSVSPTGTSRHLAVYHCRNGQTLKLLATREITWDLQVPEFKNDIPTVMEIRQKVEEARRKTEEDLEKKLKKAGADASK
jgi:hypothetical protein